ncbi:STAS/SEC14 domain-containing protein [Caulobacter sp. 17J80-11]|uniref:STAS/SEC14 domain-containing protein n=1 Tax=Caulobacter sp. 17J80-11 TaxID=2763502 RepID=UPI001653D707|nr:STAS/SEC14 domain-containing protein [Caulobacter sp. 17J80-11]MBC6981158.1 STAS/SEC14 domain-containing protein [Caulobacter sp. 17J80-11]
MIEILPAPDHVAAYRLSGELTGEDYDKVVVDLEARLARHDRLGVYVDMVDFTDMTAEALIKDIRYAFSKFGELKRFPREAVVTDRGWVKALVGLVDPIYRHTEIRTFAPDEREAALAWAQAIPA